MSLLDRTVLIVDRTPEDCELYRQCLLRDREHDYRILTAQFGQFALDLWQRHQPDVVLLGDRLPDMDSLEFIAAALALTKQPFLPAIVITTEGNEAIAQAAVKAGAEEYLVKEQITAESLRLAINSTIKTVRLRVELQLQNQLAQPQSSTEKVLPDSQEQLRLALEAARMGAWNWNTVTGKMQLSATMESLFGLSPGEFDGSFAAFINCLHPEDRKDVQQALETCLRKGSGYDIVFRVVLANGKIRWIMSKGKVYDDRTDKQMGIAGVALDISERKRAAEALHDSEERFCSLTENIDVVFWIVDFPSRNISYVSPAYERLWGLNPQALYDGREGWINLIPPEDRPSVEKAFREKAADGKFDEEYRIILPDRTVRWVRDRCFPLKDEAGMIYRFIGIAEDITDRKELEVERDRILQLEKSARAELERTNRIKDEFLAVLSHELRSPLNPILGWTKLLQTRKFDAAKTAEALVIIERNAKLQIQLIDDLLDIAKILRGKLSLNAAPVNLRLLIEAAIETVETAAAAKSIAIQALLPNIGQVSGDAVRLQQIVWNLLSNAIKFTPNGGRVEIRLDRIDGEAQIVVSDTGKGIKSDFLPHIFESFCQEDASVTRQHGGLGLGLAIVYSLVELHGGSIAAESPGEGQGATFTVRLPLLNLEPELKQTEETLKPECDLRGIRVLAIEDQADSRELLGVLLSEYGAQVMAVASHSEFLEAVESFAPDVLVSDIGMPEVDGYSLLRQVRGLSPDRGGTIPAIALTAYTRVEDFQRALAAGFQMHVSKPIDPRILVAAIFDLTAFKKLDKPE